MTEENMNVEVIVHKAITLLKGESLGQFANEMSRQGREYITRKLNLTEKDGCYMAEVFDSAAIWSCYSEKRGSTFYAMKYERGDKGVFKFGEVVPVRRATVYEPMDPMNQVTKGAWSEEEKAKKAKAAPMDEEAAKPAAKKMPWQRGAAEKKGCGGGKGGGKEVKKAVTVEVHKDFWNGVL